MVDGLNSMVPGLPSDSHGLAEFLKPFGSPSSKIYIPINMRQSCNILEDKKGKFAEEKWYVNRTEESTCTFEEF